MKKIRDTIRDTSRYENPIEMWDRIFGIPISTARDPGFVPEISWPTYYRIAMGIQSLYPIERKTGRNW